MDVDPSFGWTWDELAPWGWAPYHYGGWLFDAGCGGWFYSPPVFYGRRTFPRRHFPRVFILRALTSRRRESSFATKKSGIVPIILCEKGKTPRNLEHGVFLSCPVERNDERITGGESDKNGDPEVRAAPSAGPAALSPRRPCTAFRGPLPSRIERTFVSTAMICEFLTIRGNAAL